MIRRLVALAAAGLLLILATSPASAAPGDLDRTYSGDGITKAGFYRGGNSILVDSQGKVLVGGIHSTNDRPALLRYKANGALDTTFSGDGKTTLPTLGGVTDLAWHQSKILVLVDSTLFRLNLNGAIDKTYGGGDGQVQLGRVAVALGTYGANVFALQEPRNNWSQWVSRAQGEQITELLLPRPDGGSADFPGWYKDLATSPAGESLYVTGWTESDPNDGQELAVLSKVPSGVGPATGEWTRYADPQNSSTEGNALAVSPTNGNVVVVGTLWGDYSDGYAGFFMRVSPSGETVTERVFRGQVARDGYTDSWDIAAAYSVALAGGGKTIVGGYTHMEEDFGSDPPYESALTVWRLNNDGSLDQTFGTGGYVRTPGAGDLAFAVAVSTTKIVAAGNQYTARYLG